MHPDEELPVPDIRINANDPAAPKKNTAGSGVVKKTLGCVAIGLLCVLGKLSCDAVNVVQTKIEKERERKDEKMKKFNVSEEELERWEHLLKKIWDLKKKRDELEKNKGVHWRELQTVERDLNASFEALGHWETVMRIRAKQEKK